MEVAQCISELDHIIKKGGPNRNDYKKLRSIALELDSLSMMDEARLHDIFKPILDIDSLIGHTFIKPHGYPGDYELIDKIHRKVVSNNPFFRKWDRYYHESDSSAAVRNRKDYFINLIKSIQNGEKNINVLNLGSGPCIDVREYFYRNNAKNTMIDCVDMDEAAIEFASVVCDNYIENVNFINKNVFRFKPQKKYNLIWSSGLFDYFSDKLFIRLARTMYACLEINGELVIGNFSVQNPGKEEMEVYGKWYLNHRDEKTLTDMALKAGIDQDKISVRSEKTGVNLFLHLKK